MRKHARPANGGDSQDVEPGGSAPGRRTLVDSVYGAARIQRKRAGDSGVADGGHAAGGALDGATLQRMEKGFAADFSGVKVSQGGEAAALGADAFTRGDEVSFAPGRFAPGSETGDRLIAHELAHVVQQRSGRVTTSGAERVVDSPALEAEADGAADRVVRGEPAGIAGGSGSAPAHAPVQGKFTVEGEPFSGKDEKRALLQAQLSAPAADVTWTDAHDRVLLGWLPDEIDKGDFASWEKLAKAVDREVKRSTRSSPHDDPPPDSGKSKEKKSVSFAPTLTIVHEDEPLETEPVENQSSLEREIDALIEEVMTTFGYGQGSWLTWIPEQPPKKTIEEKHKVRGGFQYQGWKVHIGARPEKLGLIIQACTQILRDLQIGHKICTSLKHYKSLTGEQLGKAITIYPYDIGSFRQLVKAVKALDLCIAELVGLDASPDVPPGDLPLGQSGHITTRYGQSSGPTKNVVLNPKTKKMVQDDRSKFMPSFAQLPQEIFDLVPESAYPMVKQALARPRFQDSPPVEELDPLILDCVQTFFSVAQLTPEEGQDAKKFIHALLGGTATRQDGNRFSEIVGAHEKELPQGFSGKILVLMLHRLLHNERALSEQGSTH